MTLGDTTECSALENQVICHIFLHSYDTNCAHKPWACSLNGIEQYVNKKIAVSAVDYDWKSLGSFYVDKYDTPQPKSWKFPGPRGIHGEEH